MRRKEYLLGAFGILVGFLLLFPGTVNAKSCETAVAGIYGEDGNGKEAYHPEDCALGDTVLISYTMETNQPNVYGTGYVPNIRLAFSFNSGSSWSHFEWVSLDVNKEQDFSDVRVFQDYTMPAGQRIRVVVTWQERPIDGSGPWVIKARERSDATIYGTWGSVYTVSDPTDTRDNIYPKIDTTSMVSGDLATTFWGIVWQRSYTTGTYGIKLNIYFIDSNSMIGGFRTLPQDLQVPQSSSYNYRHPAIAANYISGGDAEFHIVYDATVPAGLSSYQIMVESGYVDHFVNVPNQIYTRYLHNPNPQVISTASTDISIGFPDIASCGPGGGNGHPSVTTGQAHIALVWRQVSGGNRVYIVESFDSGVTYSTAFQVSTNGAPESLRSVAVALDEQYDDQISVVYTDGNDIWFRKKVKTGGVWTWAAEERWQNDQNTDDFVDVYIIEPASSGIKYSHVCWQENQQTIMYARDP